MKAVFIELSAFERHLDEVSLRRLQSALMASPEAGDLIEGTRGLAKAALRRSATIQGQTRRCLRVIYYYWSPGPEFWLFTLYDKDEACGLTAHQRDRLKELVKIELRMSKGL